MNMNEAFELLLLAACECVVYWTKRPKRLLLCASPKSLFWLSKIAHQTRHTTYKTFSSENTKLTSPTKVHSSPTHNNTLLVCPNSLLWTHLLPLFVLSLIHRELYQPNVIISPLVYSIPGHSYSLFTHIDSSQLYQHVENNKASTSS